MRMSPWFTQFTVLVVVAASAGRADAQVRRRELVGFVRDSTGSPIEGATIDIPGGTARSDVKGAFQIWTGDIDTMTIVIRRFGYTPLTAQIAARGQQWDTVVVEMDRYAQILSAVKVKDAPVRRANGLREFESRRARGLGVFVTRAEIAERNVFRPSDVLRTKRGVHVVKIANGLYGVRFAAHSGPRARCAPDLWVDGQLARGLEIDDLSATDLEALELYENFSTVPAEFSPHSAGKAFCGTIVAWTREPGR
jgi:hypothetical protein